MLTRILEWLWIAKPEWKNNRKVSDLSKSEKLLLISLIQEEFDEMKKALLEDDEDGLFDAAVDLIWVASNPIASLGTDSTKKYINKVIAVEESNFSKFCDNEQEAKITVAAYAEGSHPSKPGQQIETKYRKVEEGYYVVERLDGKIMKSIAFIEPNKVG